MPRGPKKTGGKHGLCWKQECQEPNLTQDSRRRWEDSTRTLSLSEQDLETSLPSCMWGQHTCKIWMQSMVASLSSKHCPG